MRFQATVPREFGTYYYGACVDPVSDESDTGNNCTGSVTIETVPISPRGEVVDRDEQSLTMLLHGTRQSRLELYRSTSPEADYRIVNAAISIADNPTQYVDEGLQPNVTYYYKAKTCIDTFCSWFSHDAWGGVTEASGQVEVPPRPTNVRGERVRIALATDDARVTWDPAPRATYYEVYQYDDLDAAVSAPHTSYYDPEPNTLLGMFFVTRYHVRACNKAGCSGTFRDSCGPAEVAAAALRDPRPVRPRRRRLRRGGCRRVLTAGRAADDTHFGR